MVGDLTNLVSAGQVTSRKGSIQHPIWVPKKQNIIIPHNAIPNNSKDKGIEPTRLVFGGENQRDLR